MTPVPKKKHTRSRSNKRKNSPRYARSIPNLMKCPNCGKLKRSHTQCPHCQTYGKKP